VDRQSPIFRNLHPRLRLTNFAPQPALPPTAILIFIHGFSDHCNAYYTLFPTLASHDILTHSFDQRGWGRSVHTPADRGLTGPTSTVLADITSFIQSRLPSPAPLFLMGHSMGGAEVLHYAARGPAEVRKQITGYLVESPFVALHEASQPSPAIVFAGKLASKVVPNMHMNNRLEPKWVSRDEQVVKDYVADELCHDTGTLEGLAGMLQRAEELDKGKVKFEDREGCRLWVAHGSGDRTTSHAASARLVKRLNLKDLEFKSYDGWYHKR